MSTVSEASETEVVEKVEVEQSEYQRLLAGCEHSGKLRKKAVSIAKIRADYDKKRDASLEAKKKLDKELREYQELGEEADDEQQRLPMPEAGVDESKDPKVRKPPEQRPQDHENLEDDGWDDVDDDEDDDWDEDEGVNDSENDWSEIPVGAKGEDDEPLLDLPSGMIQSLTNNDIHTMGDLVNLRDGKNKDFPNGAVDLPTWGPGKTKRFDEAAENALVKIGALQPEDNEPADESEEGETKGNSTSDDASNADGDTVKVRIKSPSSSLTDKGLAEGKVVEGIRQGVTVIVKTDSGDDLTLIPQNFEVIA